MKQWMSKNLLVVLILSTLSFYGCGETIQLPLKEEFVPAGNSDSAGKATVTSEALKGTVTVQIQDAETNLPIEGATFNVIRQGDVVLIVFSKDGYFSSACMVDAKDIGSGKVPTQAGKRIIAKSDSQGALDHWAESSILKLLEELCNEGGIGNYVPQIKLIKAVMAGSKLLNSPTLSWEPPDSFLGKLLYRGTASLKDVQNILSITGTVTLFIPDPTVTKIISGVTFAESLAIDISGIAGVDLDRQYDWYQIPPLLAGGAPIFIPMPHKSSRQLTVNILPDKSTLNSGESTVLRASVNDGILPYNYSWSAPDGWTSTAQNTTISPIQTTTYTLTVTDSSTPTKKTATVKKMITVIGGNNLVANATADNTVINFGQSTALRGSASGGTPPYSYYWSAPGGWTSTDQNPTVSPTQATEYTLTVTDSSTPTKKTATNKITITVNGGNNLVATATADNTVINSGQSTTLRGSVSGGTPPYSYSWSAPGGWTSTEQDPTVTPNISTEYTLTGKDSSSPQKTALAKVAISIGGESYHFVKSWRVAYPYGISIDTQNNLYVVEVAEDRVLKFTRDGDILKTFPAMFEYPVGITISPSGNIFVSDTYHVKIFQLSPEGTLLATIGEPGLGEGQLAGPVDIALDPSGNIFVLSSLGLRIQKFTAQGVYLSKISLESMGNGIAVSSTSHIFVTDIVKHRVLKYTAEGNLETSWGSLGQGDGQFNLPSGVAVDSSGFVYIADSNNNRIQKFTYNGSFITKWGSGGNGDGKFNGPMRLTVDADGNVYVSDSGHNCIQKFAPGPGANSDPIFTPPDGTTIPQAGLDVAISCSTSEATIRYTTDGNTPSQTVGTIYSTPVHLAQTTNLKAIAYKDGMMDSSVVSATYTSSPSGNTIAIDCSNGVMMELVKIPTGSFQMGTNSTDDNWLSYSRPVHQVTISKFFYMGKYEVTQEQYQAVMGTNPSYFTGDAKRPVEQVSWDDAVAFCQALATKSGYNIRLPSEAEWEYACKADKGNVDKKYYFGDDETQLGNYAWYADNSQSTTHAVGTRTPNSFGFYDMSGNVWELCQDVAHKDYINAPTDGIAWTTGGDQSIHVLRGGAYDGSSLSNRSSLRFGVAVSDKFSDYGFRVVLGN